MSNPKARVVPGWMAFMNADHPFVRALAGRPLQVEFVPYAKVQHEDARRLLEDGWVDARMAPGGAALYTSMNELFDAVLDAPLGVRPEDTGYADTHNRLWTTCLSWFDTTRSPLVVTAWPPWLSMLAFKARNPAKHRRRPAAVTYLALSFPLKRGLTPDSMMLGTIGADFLRDMMLVASPAVDRRRLGRCAGCRRAFIRTRVPRTFVAPNELRRVPNGAPIETIDAATLPPSSHGSDHLYCQGDPCRDSRRAQIDRLKAQARTVPPGASSSVEVPSLQVEPR